MFFQSPTPPITVYQERLVHMIRLDFATSITDVEDVIASTAFGRFAPVGQVPFFSRTVGGFGCESAVRRDVKERCEFRGEVIFGFFENVRRLIAGRRRGLGGRGGEGENHDLSL